MTAPRPTAPALTPTRPHPAQQDPPCQSPQSYARGPGGEDGPTSLPSPVRAPFTESVRQCLASIFYVAAVTAISLSTSSRSLSSSHVIDLQTQTLCSMLTPAESGRILQWVERRCHGQHCPCTMICCTMTGVWD